ncbi:apoptosis regulatory protein Siva-like [Watersipora subatra]|uniref:apoptosis regulatory protein Siva-like n=1 Tax=Watersipora subatra TaxID=2589382 RepID=UPI00355C7D84
MPKRNCPFVESNRPQLKTHIGLQELSMGVMGVNTMSGVYERTLKLMYQNSSRQISEKENMTISNDDTGAPSNILPGQRKLNLSGQLDGFYSKELGVSASPSQGSFLPIACSSCSHIPSVAKTCKFCECCLCEFCCRDCYSCHHTFCIDCSTIRPNSGDMDTCICLSCV